MLAVSLGRFLDEQHHVSLEDMARHYVAEIRSVQAEGPHLVGGHSMGAKVAFETAHQLEQAGQAVGLLAIFDGELRRIESAMAETLMLVSTTFELGITRAELAGLIEGEMVAYVLRKAKKRFSRVLEIAYDLDVLPRGFRTRDAELFLSRIANNIDLSTRFSPQPIEARVHLFTVTEFAASGKQIDTDAWRQNVRGGVEVIPVPSNHITLMKAPHVATLAAHMRRQLDRVHASRAGAERLQGEPLVQACGTPQRRPSVPISIRLASQDPPP